MELRFLKFVGPSKQNAEIYFSNGLNLIYGPSNSGKSSILDAIDFMLGRSTALKELPQHEGYDQIYLGVKFSDSEEYTFVRNINGGNYEYYSGLSSEKPNLTNILKISKSKNDSVDFSQFFMERIGLSGKRLKKNAKNDTVSLTIRSLIPLILINEKNIQKEGSPFISEQYTEQTMHKSRLKLLLTGVDDSSILPIDSKDKITSYQSRIELIDELIEENKNAAEQYLDDDNTYEDLEDQKQKLSEKIRQEKNLLVGKEEEYREYILKRQQTRDIISNYYERINEITEMIARFTLLNSQYETDIKRLENISEAGDILAYLPLDKCPYCGKQIDDKTEDDCFDERVHETTLAAEAEKSKLIRLYFELSEAMSLLKEEKQNILLDIPQIEDNLVQINHRISELSPNLSDHRKSFSQLMEIQSSLDRSLFIISQIDTLNKKRKDMEAQMPLTNTKDNSDASVPTKSINDLAQDVKQLLNEWNFPDAETVYFDKTTGDFVINGKHRSSNGKGYRAITHAAATLALMKFCQENQRAHPGFVLLDSPLLAYEKPEDEQDDLTNTDVNKKFFDSVYKWRSRQIIIFENKKSIPEEYETGKSITQFTKSSTGRYGFFPV